MLSLYGQCVTYVACPLELAMLSLLPPKLAVLSLYGQCVKYVVCPLELAMLSLLPPKLAVLSLYGQCVTWALQSLLVWAVCNIGATVSVGVGSV